MSIIKKNIGLAISTIIGFVLLTVSFYTYFYQGSERALVIFLFAIIFNIAIASSWKEKIKK